MGKIENIVKDHYSVGNLDENILVGLAKTGKDIDNLTIDDLSVVDEFHIGGRKATEHALEKLALKGDEHVLDVGCGIGGAARTMATLTGCRVSGIDLTPEYVEVARQLTLLTRLEEKVDFQAASALSMPFDDAAFDAVITIHVAMNIEDRAGLYKECARVMKPGARLCIYDVMKKNDGPFAFPVPWAAAPESSHLRTPEEVGMFLQKAGFEVLEVEDRTEFAFDYFKARLAAASGEPSPLGPHIIMGPTAPEKFRNISKNMENGLIAPVVILAQRL